MEGTPHAERRKAAEVTSHRRVAECNTKKQILSRWKSRVKNTKEKERKKLRVDGVQGRLSESFQPT